MRFKCIEREESIDRESVCPTLSVPRTCTTRISSELLLIVVSKCVWCTLTWIDTSLSSTPRDSKICENMGSNASWYENLHGNRGEQRSLDTYAHVFACTCVLHAHVFANTCVCMHMCLHVHVFACTCSYVYMCLRVLCVLNAPLGCVRLSSRKSPCAHKNQLYTQQIFSHVDLPKNVDTHMNTRIYISIVFSI